MKKLICFLILLFVLSANATHTAKLVWFQALVDTAYIEEHSTDTAFASGNVFDTTTTDTFKIITVNCATKYFWRVKGGNGSGWSNWSDEYDFITNCGGGHGGSWGFGFQNWWRRTFR